MTLIDCGAWRNHDLKLIEISPTIKVQENYGAFLSTYFYRMRKVTTSLDMFCLSCLKNYCSQERGADSDFHEELHLFFNPIYCSKLNQSFFQDVNDGSKGRLTFYLENNSFIDFNQVYNFRKYVDDTYRYFAVFEDNDCFYAVICELS